MLSFVVDGVDHQIDDIARQVGIQPDQLDKDCSEQHLLPISEKLTTWQLIARHLGLSELMIQHIQTDITLGAAANMRPLAMLRQWKKSCAYTSKGHYRHLIRGCIEVTKDRDVAGQICKLLL